ncbi:MAG: protein phosphatase, partial [Streptomyces sp.]|nr:protein phosphatase [Streptomyces sp.]
GPSGAFGPPGSGGPVPGAAGAPLGTFGEHADADLDKPRKNRRWVKRTVIGAVVLAVVAGGGLYGVYAWAQTQYYVGANGDHVAVYQGIDQKLAWISLSKLHKDRTDIELKYLPAYQRDQVVNTIAVSSLSQANDKADELAKQASVCKEISQQNAHNATKGSTKDKIVGAVPGGAKPGSAGSAGAPLVKGTPTPTKTTPGATASPTATATATPTQAPAPTRTPDDKLAANCASGQQ